jgi:hypothetical protein
MRVFFSSVALAVALTACGGGASNSAQQTACDTPKGCVRADRVSGTCQCQEWQVVSAEPVPLKFVVVGLIYSALGNQSWLAMGDNRLLGVTSGSGSSPASSSDFGTRWRSVIQTASGSQTVSTLGPSDLDPQHSEWPFTAVTADSAAFALTSSGGMGMDTYSDVDVNSHEFDQFVLWVNPAAVVITNYVGEKTVSWSWTSQCYEPDGCPGSWISFFRAGELDGTLSPLPAPKQALLATLDADDRAAILKYDPFFEPGRDPATIATDPRFRNLGTTTFGPNVITTPPPPLTWTPCSGTLKDDGFQTLAETDVPFGAGETLMLQHSVLSTTASCAPQQPGLTVGTTTPNCWITADILVDTLFGSLLMIPTSVGPSCSAGP